MAWLALVITGLGTLFLFGELLVNMRGIFGVVGIAFITFYFLTHLDPSMFIVMMIVYFISLSLIILDAKVINDGTLTTVGSISMLLVVGMSAPDWVTGAYGVCGVLIGAIGSLLFLRVFPKRDLWTKITLVDKLSSEAGYNSMNETYASLVGKSGITLTQLRPVGTIKIEEQEYSAVSNGHWIDKDEEIIVDQVDGTRILVRKS
nr:NfeD family protein [Pontibacillus sp. HN14]